MIPALTVKRAAAAVNAANRTGARSGNDAPKGVSGHIVKWSVRTDPARAPDLIEHTGVYDISLVVPHSLPPLHRGADARLTELLADREATFALWYVQPILRSTWTPAEKIAADGLRRRLSRWAQRVSSTPPFTGESVADVAHDERSPPRPSGLLDIVMREGGWRVAVDWEVRGERPACKRRMGTLCLSPGGAEIIWDDAPGNTNPFGAVYTMLSFSRELDARGEPFAVLEWLCSEADEVHALMLFKKRRGYVADATLSHHERRRLGIEFVPGRAKVDQVTW